jgi:RecB family exonuclease
VSTVYSHSRLASFENCPRQFWFRYVERVPIETESVEAFAGKRVHEVLERLNRFVERGLVPSLAKVLQRFRALWDEHFAAERIRIVRADATADQYRENGERCLANHYRRHYPFDADESLGIEHRVAFSLDGGGRYRVQGVVDRIVRARDGAVEIHDYKTGRWVPSQQSLDQDRQLALYQIGVQESFGARSVRLVWHYLLRDQLRVSTRSAEQLDALRASTAQLIDRIEAETEFEPRPNVLCAWCEFRELCPAARQPAERRPAAEPVAMARERRAALHAPARAAAAPAQLSLL